MSRGRIPLGRRRSVTLLLRRVPCIPTGDVGDSSIPAATRFPSATPRRIQRACLPGASIPPPQGVNHFHMRTRSRRLLRQLEAQSASYPLGIGQDETCPWPIDCSVRVAHGDAGPTWDNLPPSGPSVYIASTGILQPSHSRLPGVGSLWPCFARLIPSELFSDGPGTRVLLEPVLVDGSELPPRAQRPPRLALSVVPLSSSGTYRLEFGRCGTAPPRSSLVYYVRVK